MLDILMKAGCYIAIILLGMALRAIGANKVRSFLTMLGVIIGVMSVTVLIAIGQGTTASVTESISAMGTNLLTVNISARSMGISPFSSVIRSLMVN